MIAIRLLVGGAVVREAVFKSDSVVIGRGPESDFVIVDPTVSHQHARLRTDETGAVWIEDAGSRNGLVVGGRRVATACVPALGILRCQLGASEVEVATISISMSVTTEFSVPQISIARPPGVVKALSLWVAGIAAGPALIVMEPGFWSPWKDDYLPKLSIMVLIMAVSLPVLAFALVGVLRIAGRMARVTDALRALVLVFWGFVLVGLLQAAADYGLSVRTHQVVSSLLGDGGLAIAIAYLAAVGRPGPRRRFFAAWAAAIAILLAGVNGAGRLAAHQKGEPQLDYDLHVPVAGVTGPSTDLDGFLGAVGADFATADRKAQEERRRFEPSRP